MHIKAGQTPMPVSFESANLKPQIQQEYQIQVVGELTYSSSSLSSESAVYEWPMRAEKYQVINFSKPDEPTQYRYGDLTSAEDIEAFLSHLDRLDKDQSHILSNYKPSKAFLNLLDKMGDDTLKQFVDVLSRSFNLDGMLSDNGQRATELIDLMSKMSEDEILNTVNTLTKLADQQESYKNITISASTISGHESRIYSDAADFHELLMQKFNNTDVTRQYVELLANHQYSNDEMTNINAHIQQSTYEQSLGIIDMAKTVKRNDRSAFMRMLNNADKDNANNVFAFVSQQINVDLHTSAYENAEGGVILVSDALPTQSQRREFYSQLLTTYETRGSGWLEQVVEQVKDRPPQIQQQLFASMNNDLDLKPELYNGADAVNLWMKLNLPSILKDFEQQQTELIHKRAQQSGFPEKLGKLTWVKQTDLLFEQTQG